MSREKAKKNMKSLRLWVLPVLLVFLFNYHLVPCTKLATATEQGSLNVHQRPRFHIPHGNLSYYKSPQWEILYYLKFGVFPFYSTSSSSFLNRTQYLDKIRLIKSLMDDEALAAQLEKQLQEKASQHDPEDGLGPVPRGTSRDFDIQDGGEPQDIEGRFYYPQAQVPKAGGPQSYFKKLKREEEEEGPDFRGGIDGNSGGPNGRVLAPPAAPVPSATASQQRYTFLRNTQMPWWKGNGGFKETRSSNPNPRRYLPAVGFDGILSPGRGRCRFSGCQGKVL